MSKLISKTRLEKNFPAEEIKESYNFGEIFPEIFESDKKLEFKEDMDMEASFTVIGGYTVKSSASPKIKCPVCGKEEVLIPYQVVASGLSGCHIIKFYCLNCHERFVTNNYKRYYKKVFNYVFKNLKNLPKNNKIEPTISLDSVIII